MSCLRGRPLWELQRVPQRRVRTVCPALRHLRDQEASRPRAAGRRVGGYRQAEVGGHAPIVLGAGKVEATYEHGVLTVRIPKAEGAKPKQVPVKVKEAARAR